MRQTLAFLRQHWMEVIAEAAASDARPDQDPIAWVEQALGFNLDPWQREFLSRAHHRTLLLTARQVGKSTATAALAAKELVFTPGIRIAVISPTLRQSGMLFEKAMAMLRNAAADITRATATRVILANGAELQSLPGDRPAFVRGLTADVLMVDEAAQIKNALLTAILPTISASGGAIIMLSTPHGATGVFYESWTSKTEAWQRVKISADQCPRHTPEMLEFMKNRLGDRGYRQEFELAFLNTAGGLFDADMLSTIFDTPSHFEGPSIHTSSRDAVLPPTGSVSKPLF